MKTTKLLYIGVALLMAGCSAENEPEVGGRTPIKLGYTVLQANETRAATDLNNSHLAANDKVMVKVSTADANTYDQSCTYLAIDNTGGMVPAGTAIPTYPDNNAHVDIVAYYPSTAGTTFTVKADQTSDDNYKASDLMFASISNQAATTETVNLTFAHQMAKIIVNASAASGSGITISGVTLKNIAPTVTFTQTAAVDYTTNAATGSVERRCRPHPPADGRWPVPRHLHLCRQCHLQPQQGVPCRPPVHPQHYRQLCRSRDYQHDYGVE